MIDNMIIGLMVVIWILYTVLCLVIYHKIFNLVIYFDFGKAFFAEIGSACAIGAILLGLTMYFWWVVDIIIAISALVLFIKCNSNVARVFTAIGAIALGVAIFYMGISLHAA